MRYFVIQNEDENGISTYDGTVVPLRATSVTQMEINRSKTYIKLTVDLVYRERIERKTGHIIDEHPIKDISLLHYFDVICDKNQLTLKVLKASFDGKLSLHEVYSCTAEKGKTGIIESEEGMLDFWHEFFVNDIQRNNNYGCEKIVNLFSIKDNPMREVHKLFPVYMQENPFLFFKRYRNQKKLYPEYDSKIFNLPQKRINNHVGKKYDNQYIHYALTSDEEINGQAFLDTTVISGFVKDGIMDIEEKHRFFLTENFIYAVDEGDSGVFVSTFLEGNYKFNKIAKCCPSLYMDRYDGKYPFMYIFSREFLTPFEILAKAGFEKYADMFIDSYMNYEEWEHENKHKYTYRCHMAPRRIPIIVDPSPNDNSAAIKPIVNINGKNDKSIFGFKLSVLKKVEFPTSKSKDVSFYNFFTTIKEIYALDPNIFKDFIDEDLLYYLSLNLKKSKNLLMKELEYLKKIGTYNQGLYSDYLRMCSQTNRYHDGKFPKNLKLSHDVMVSYLNELKEVKNNVRFKDTVAEEHYLCNLYEPVGEKYCILAPRKADDLAQESYALSHCVRSYIPDVATGSTRIYFLRLQEKKSKPLVTVQLSNGDCIVQARGKGNRNLTSEEKNFLYKWALEKNLSMTTYY